MFTSEAFRRATGPFDENRDPNVNSDLNSNIDPNSDGIAQDVEAGIEKRVGSQARWVSLPFLAAEDPADLGNDLNDGVSIDFT